MAALSDLTKRIEALESIVGERDARITALENALQSAEAKMASITVAGGGAVALSAAEKEWPAARVREAFIEFFRDEFEHTFWKSSPCVPHDDPTLLFTNAGMNQFKPLFLGQCDPTMPMYGMQRAVNSQKCIRAGGKHNDLDDVGKDVYHHTYFEMLGNWSFGDYFKEKAIEMAWKCLTEKFKLDPERLYVTYFGGDAVKAPGVPADEETKQIWLKYVPASRLMPFDAADNFWEMGDVGPCGPCTEIHYDRIGGRDASALVNMDDPDVLEIWNNVFIQYNREADGLKNLPAQHVDTGMGFERLTSILQDKRSNYDTDVFRPLFAAIQEVTGAAPYGGRVGDADVETVDMAYRVVADHIRTLSFAIADGAMPDTVGRGYVLRRILRRAVYFGRFLGVPEGTCFFSRLVPCVVATYGDFFTELVAAEEKITRVLLKEETQFNRTIAQGMKVFEKKVKALAAAGTTVLPGAFAFLLSGSMGFPLDLTEIMCEARGLTVDKAAYEALVEKEKAGNLKGGGEGQKDMVMMAKETAFLQDKGLAPTNQEAKYDDLGESGLTATVLAVFTGRGGLPEEKGFVDACGPGDGLVGVVLDATAFYAQAGGQVYDTGLLTGGAGDDETSFAVTDVQVYGGYVVHLGTVQDGFASLRVGAALQCVVDYERRGLVVPNHTMTHVVNHALREVLLGGVDPEAEAAGKVQQKGSDVNAERLRFDFSWDDALTAAQLRAVEQRANAAIAADLVVDARVVPLHDAMAIHGLRAVFGETYPDPVRVVSIGADVGALLAAPASEQWGAFSVEFCGGTHLPNLAHAERLVITDESSTSAGVRRLTAVTRQRAADAAASGKALLAAVAEAEAAKDGVVASPGPALVAAAKKLKKAIGEWGPVPQADKYDAVARCASLETAALEYSKAATKKLAAEAVTAAEALVASGTLAGGLGCKAVARIDYGSGKTTGKTNSAVMKVLSGGNKEGSFLVVSHDVEEGKVCCFATVAKAQESLSALAWCEAALAPLAAPAKCGGKEKNANGAAAGAEADVAAVLAAAEAFVA